MQVNNNKPVAFKGAIILPFNTHTYINRVAEFEKEFGKVAIKSVLPVESASFFFTDFNLEKVAKEFAKKLGLPVVHIDNPNMTKKQFDEIHPFIKFG